MWSIASVLAAFFLAASADVLSTPYGVSLIQKGTAVSTGLGLGGAGALFGGAYPNLDFGGLGTYGVAGLGYGGPAYGGLAGLGYGGFGYGTPAIGYGGYPLNSYGLGTYGGYGLGTYGGYGLGTYGGYGLPYGSAFSGIGGSYPVGLYGGNSNVYSL